MAKKQSGRAVDIGTLPARFWQKVVQTSGCWHWRGTTGRGYGMFWWRGRTIVAHRLCYMSLVGPIPENRELDHLCRNRGCVNPEHLRVVDHRTNVLAGTAKSAINAAKICCPKGHPLEQRGAQRRCMVCRRDQERQKARSERMAKWDRIWAEAGV